MSTLAIKGHRTRGSEIIEILEMLGGINWPYSKYFGNEPTLVYYINNHGYIFADEINNTSKCVIYTLEEFLENFPYRIGDKVIVKGLPEYPKTIRYMKWFVGNIHYSFDNETWFLPSALQPYKEEIMEDKGNISDGYHTFNELYKYRLLYNAGMFNELAKQGLYDVHKSKRHSDGTIPFGNENWFIVQAELPTGQISNHYEMKDWELFNIPEKEKANHYDGHTPQDVAKRLRNFLTPKPQYPKTYEECCDLLVNYDKYSEILVAIAGVSYKANLIKSFTKLLICRDAYWEIAGKELGLGKPWKPDWDNYDDTKYCIYTTENIISLDLFGVDNKILAFPTEKMRNAFYKNFKELIETCKELL